MDSMKSLNTSLPSSQPPEQLLQAFKNAALSVTTLYKTAASDQAQARQNGYQDALDELLQFLDKEHLGLSDGEGWKVRRWATERLEGNTTGAAVAGSESDDEKGESEKRARSVSPLMHYKPAAPENHASQEQQHPPHASPIKNTSTPTITQNPPQPPTSAPASNPTMPPMFHFRSPHPPSQDTDMASSGISATSPDSTQPDIVSVPPIPTPPPTVRLEVLPRGPRTPHRHNNSHPSRHNTRSSTTTSKRSLGLGAGSKRRIDPSDYFPDLDGRDGFGGGSGAKRGRWE